MKRITLAAVAATSLVLVSGHQPVRAAGEPQCNTGQTAGAVPGKDFGTQADVNAKKELDAQKYAKAGANAATEACQQSQNAASSGQKQ